MSPINFCRKNINARVFMSNCDRWLKNGYNSRISNEENNGLIQTNQQQRQHDKIVLERRQRFGLVKSKTVFVMTSQIWWDGYCCSLSTTNDEFEPCIDHRTSEMGSKTWKMILLHDNTSKQYYESCPGNFNRIELRCATSPTVFSRHYSFKLPLVYRLAKIWRYVVASNCRYFN